MESSPFFSRWPHLNDDDAFADAAVLLLRDGGLDRLSLGAVARTLRMATSTAHRLGDGRAGMIELAVRAFARRWRDWTAPRLTDEAPVRLPRDDDEIHGVRVHRALTELAAGEARAGRPAPAENLAWADRCEERYVARRLEERRGHRVPDDELEALLHLGRGLRSAVANQVEALSPARAEALLVAHLEPSLGLRPSPSPTDAR